MHDLIDFYPRFIVKSLDLSNILSQLQVFHPPVFGHQTADPKSVASIILGGGPGKQLFPLTSTRATPAVRISCPFFS